LRMHSTGRPREEAERFLTRFRQSEDYLPMLDEIYSQETDAVPRRRFGRRRRR